MGVLKFNPLSIFYPQNPGISGLDELTPAEELFLTTFAGVSWIKGSVPFVNSSGGNFTQDNSNLFFDETNKRLGIGTASPSKKLDIVGDGINLENTTTDSTGIIWKNGVRFMHNFRHPTGGTAVPVGQNTFIGEGAGNFTMGSTASSPSHGSYNVGVGYQVLQANTTGYYNSALGAGALRSNTTGYNNSALGLNAGRYIADGTTDNETSNNSVFLGSGTRALSAGNTNQIVIGSGAIGLGSNSVVLGNDNITTTALKGNVGIGTTSPYAKLSVKGAGLTTGVNFQTTNSSDSPLFTILDSGNVGIGTTSPTAKLDVNSDIIRLRTAKTPASAGATGNAGDICWDASYIYVCVATNTWVRSALTTW